jgi:hypothetical protein
MELKLENFVSGLELLTDIHNQNRNPVTVRITARDTGKALVFFCGYVKPKYVVLPINVVWIDFDPDSATFRTAFKRKESAANPDQDVWEALYFYEDAFADQTYNEDDLKLVSLELPNPATSLIHGVGYLTTAEPDSKVVVEGDYRLANNRIPKDHIHEEKPASMLKALSSDTVYPIADQPNPELYQTLRCINGLYVWGKVQESDLAGGMPE